jgi:hypothetical protein
MPRHYYAIEYAYGQDTINHGNRPNLIHRFESEAERDQFCEAGPDYTTESGYAEPLPSTDPRVRRAIRASQDRWGPASWPISQFDL